MMKAVRIHGYGEPEVLQLEDAPRPEPGPREVLVEVHAAAVNPADYKIRKGYLKAVLPLRMPFILGMDISGVVAAVGAKVTGFAVGDEVFASPYHRRQGGYAEYICVPEVELARKPQRLSHAEAAAIPLVGLTAWGCLVEACRVQEGDRCFVQAGSSGVGSIGIQIARAMGAEVATSCGTRNIGLVRDLGATQVVDYTSEAIADAITRPQDVVVDIFGAGSPELLAIAARGGRMAAISSPMPEKVQAHGPVLGTLVAGYIMARNVVVARLRHGVRLHHVVRKSKGAWLAQLADLIERGQIDPVIDRVLPLDDIQEAHRLQEAGHATGKIVLAVR